MNRRLTRLALRAYPLAFRRRYGEEMQALLEQTPARGWAVLDLLRGALVAQLRPPAGLAGMLSRDERLRMSASGVLACWVAFAVAGFGFGLTTEDPQFGAAGDSHRLLGGAHATVQLLAIVASIVIVAGAVPLVGCALRHARRRQSMRLVISLPVIAVIVFVALTRVLVAIAGQSHRGTHTGAFAFIAWGLAGLVCCAVCVLAARRILFSMPLARRWLLASFACGVLVTAAMVAMTLATALYTVALAVDASALAGAPNGPLQLTSVSISLVLQLVVMIVAGALATITTRRGWQAVSVAR
jgi:uncharacterized membrane protein YidH (DUF202 family)